MVEPMQGVEEAEYALRLMERLGAEYAETYLENSHYRSFSIEEGRLDDSEYGEETGLRLRFVKNKRLYVISTNVLEKERIRGLLSRFRHFQGLDTALSREKAVRASYRIREKKRVEDADLLKDLLKIDKELGRIKYVKFKILDGGLGRAITHYTNSDGSEIRSDTPYVSTSFALTVSNGRESRQSIIQLGTTGGYENFDSDDIVSNLLNTAKDTYNIIDKGIVLNKSELRGIRNVVISSEITGIAAHESIGHPNEADRIFGREAAQAGTSYMTKDNLGLEIGSEQVTIIDDPTIKDSFGYYLYDDEGIKARAKTLVKRGRQNELLVNREYARVLKQKSNGSARSDSYSNEPLIRMSNTYLKPGRADLDELIKEAKNGIYLKRFDNTEWNIDDTRSFARYRGNEAYLIRNGRVDKPVKNYELEVYTLDFWHAVKLVGNDFELSAASCGKGEPLQGVPVTCGGASALLEFG